jgi:hypothetical protein
MSTANCTFIIHLSSGIAEFNVLPESKAGFGLVIRGSGVGYAVIVLPFHGVALMNGHCCRLKLELADCNRNHLWLGGWFALACDENHTAISAANRTSVADAGLRLRS